MADCTEKLDDHVGFGRRSDHRGGRRLNCWKGSVFTMLDKYVLAELLNETKFR